MATLKPLDIHYGLSLDGTLVLDRERNLAVENASIKNLNVTGTLTAINTTDSYLKDNNILLNSGIEAGAVTALGTITGGNGYTQGSYRNVPLTVAPGTPGIGATADITVGVNGTVTAIEIVNGGYGYTTSTVFGVSAADIDSDDNGTGFQVPVTGVSDGAAATDASITVARGTTGADVAIKWDEITTDRWQLTNNGTNYYSIYVTDDASTSATADKLVLRDASGNINVTDIGAADGTFSGDVEVKGGDLTTTATTATLFNTNATALSIGGDATSITIGASGAHTTTIRSGTVVGTQSTQNIFNTEATTINAFGDATSIDIGASTGTTSINNNLDVDLDLNIDGGDLTTNQTTFNLLNANATTVNFAGAATSLNIANNGTNARTVNLATAATDGASTLTFGGAVSGNILKISGTTDGEISLTTDVTTGTANLFTSVTGKVQVGGRGTKLYAGTQTAITGTTTTIASINPEVTDIFDRNEFRSAEYLVQITQGSLYQVSKIILVHNGTTPYITEYGTVLSGSSTLGTLDAEISGDDVRLLVTMGNNTESIVKVSRTSITV